MASHKSNSNVVLPPLPILHLALNRPLADGDLVQIAVTVNDLRAMQQEHGNWKPGMEEIIDKIGRIEWMNQNTAHVKFDAANKYPFNKETLKRYSLLPVGAIVNVLSNSEHECSMEWEMSNIQVMGKIGRVKRLSRDGENADVEFVIHGRTTVKTLPVCHVQLQPETPLMKYFEELESQISQILFKAVVNGEANTVKLLLDRCSINVDARGCDGSNPLHMTCFNGDINIVKLLLEYGASLKVEDANGRLPIHLAALGSHVDVLKYLMERRSPLNHRSIDGLTAYHLAAVMGHIECVKLFLANKEFNADIMDQGGNTALHLVIQEGSSMKEIIELMVSSGKMNLTLRNKKYSNVLHLAAVNNLNVSVIEHILKHFNGKLLEEVVTTQDSNGMTPIHLALAHHHEHLKVAELYREYVPSMANFIFQLLEVLKRGSADQQGSNNPSVGIAVTSHQVVASEQESLVGERPINDILQLHFENELENDKFDLCHYIYPLSIMSPMTPEHAETENVDVPGSSSDTTSVPSGSHSNILHGENEVNMFTTAAGVNEVGGNGSSRVMADQHQSSEELLARSFSPDDIYLITEAISTTVESTKGGTEPVSLPPTNLLEHPPTSSPRSDTRPNSTLQDLGVFLGNFVISNDDSQHVPLKSKVTMTLDDGNGNVIVATVDPASVGESSDYSEATSPTDTNGDLPSTSALNSQHHSYGPSYAWKMEEKLIRGKISEFKKYVEDGLGNNFAQRSKTTYQCTANTLPPNGKMKKCHATVVVTETTQGNKYTLKNNHEEHCRSVPAAQKRRNLSGDAQPARKRKNDKGAICA